MCGLVLCVDKINSLSLFCLLYYTQLGNMLIDALAKYYFGLPFDAEGQIVSAEIISTCREVHQTSLCIFHHISCSGPNFCLLFMLCVFYGLCVVWFVCILFSFQQAPLMRFFFN